MYVPLEKLFEKTGSMYKLVILAARRALELNDGAPSLMGVDSKKKAPLVALEEIVAGKIAIKPKKLEKK